MTHDNEHDYDLDYREHLYLEEREKEESEKRPAYLLRFPSLQVRNKLKADAKAQGRSLNAHINYILAQWKAK